MLPDPLPLPRCCPRRLPHLPDAASVVAVNFQFTGPRLPPERGLGGPAAFEEGVAHPGDDTVRVAHVLADNLDDDPAVLT